MNQSFLKFIHESDQNTMANMIQSWYRITICHYRLFQLVEKGANAHKVFQDNHICREKYRFEDTNNVKK